MMSQYTTKSIRRSGIIIGSIVVLLLWQSLSSHRAMALMYCAVSCTQQNSSATLNAGSLTEIVTGAPSVSVTLSNGQNNTSPATLVVQITDATGSGAGWHITATSNLFTDTIPSPTPTYIPANQFPSNAAQFGGDGAVSSVCASGSTCQLPNNIYSYPLTLPAAATPPAPVSFFDASSGTGMGVSILTANLAITVPGNTIPGLYTDTITIAIIAGP